jgi:hypothetical protein
MSLVRFFTTLPNSSQWSFTRDDMPCTAIKLSEADLVSIRHPQVGWVTLGWRSDGLRNEIVLVMFDNWTSPTTVIRLADDTIYSVYEGWPCAAALRTVNTLRLPDAVVQWAFTAPVPAPTVEGALVVVGGRAFDRDDVSGT